MAAANGPGHISHLPTLVIIIMFMMIMIMISDHNDHDHDHDDGDHDDGDHDDGDHDDDALHMGLEGFFHGSTFTPQKKTLNHTILNKSHV